ncbi:heterokaryon incompatibility protein-domain-containing protein [Hypoxylon trugodes]|uniref:heterokaryon incompatibility protein-domain-containing protein n=1 Tax=Hypoxylon trugodes TaxID=326681 RepID=UPI00219CC464|nr:heterokaryon incompatibility protein-domain-containing protein [Hypoxylon trugodes]KAI1392657.1 heterokaryon incompatibility protein-domain-containing protein [Hypoxylon trugodes]
MLDDDVIEIILPETWNVDPSNEAGITASSGNNAEVCERCFDAQQVIRTEKCIRCRILKLLLEYLGPDYQPPLHIIIEDSVGIRKLPDGEYEDFDLFVDDACIDPPVWLPRGNTTWSSHSSSAESLEWTRREIDNCVNTHTCCRSLDDSFMPTRVINICPENVAGDVFLQDGASVPRGSRYCALSYCWGDVKPDCLTTKTTLAQRQSNIPWSTLPQTFQDAIHWARSAGVDYLWIDSVCILQGDRDDWLRESGKMFQVYQNSYVTIVAAFGKDPTTGLFSAYPDEPKPKLLATLRLEGTGSAWPLYMRKAQHFHFYDWDNFEMREALPLLKRAWCYQERLISPRILFYTPTEVAFQCFEVASCECGRDNVVCNSMMTSPKQRFPVPGKQGQAHNKLLNDWETVLQIYISMDITMKSDRLPAIAGIAEYFQKLRPNENYLAGLWSGDLLRDLLWEVVEVFARSAAKTQTAGVPSWSWAFSSDTRDVVTPGPLHYLAEVREAECSYANDNQFGVPTRSKLVLDGRLWKISALGRRTDSLWILSRRALFKFDLSQEGRWGFTLDSGPAERNWFAVRRLYLLEIGQSFTSDGVTLDFTYYLILKSTRDPGNSYVRVGVFHQAHDVLGKSDRERWDKLGKWSLCEIK